jgi:hypothetical protein
MQGWVSIAKGVGRGDDQGKDIPDGSRSVLR